MDKACASLTELFSFLIAFEVSLAPKLTSVQPTVIAVIARKKLRSPNKPPDKRIISPRSRHGIPVVRLSVNSLYTGFESDMRNLGQCCRAASDWRAPQNWDAGY